MRILLDTNIWRYIVDHDALGVIQQAARKSRHRIVIAPAVVYEALRTGDPGLRAAMVAAMTLPCWKRLMPEAFSESEEIKAEVERLRPDWLRRSNDLSMYRRLRYDWTRSRGGFWDRARYDTARESQRTDRPQMLEAARTSAREAREAALSMPGHWKDAPPQGHAGEALPSPPPGVGWQSCRAMAYRSARLSGAGDEYARAPVC